MVTDDLTSALSSVFIAVTSMNSDVQWLTRPGNNEQIHISGNNEHILRPGNNKHFYRSGNN